MYINPQQVYKFLSIITDFLIEYIEYFRVKTSNMTCGYIWPYTFFPPEFGAALTEDLMPLISEDLYLKFGIPFLKIISSHFGGLQIHCCGQYGRHVNNLAESNLNIKAIEFHHPYTTIQELAPLASSTVFVPYIAIEKQSEFKSVSDFYYYLLTKTPDRFRYWFAFPADTEEAISFAKENEKYYL